jgi:hypothetical protein
MLKHSIFKLGKTPWFPIVVIVMCSLLSTTMALSTALACEEFDSYENGITLSVNELQLGDALEVYGSIPS